MSNEIENLESTIDQLDLDSHSNHSRKTQFSQVHVEHNPQNVRLQNQSQYIRKDWNHTKYVTPQMEWN